MSPDTSNPDFMQVADLLTEDERQVQAAVARFVDERVLPIIAACFEQERFPAELVPEMAALGLFGPTLRDYGCAGLSNVAYGLIMQELERGDSGLRSFASVQSGLVMYPIHRYGTDEQRQRWLPAMARGEAIGCFGLTEPDGGSDPGTMKTHAQKAGGDWLINGAKMWITNGTLADVAVVWARTDDDIRGFLVERGTPGYTARDIQHKFSLRASVTSELFFDNCRVPERNCLPTARGARRSAELPDAGPLRHRVGRDRCGPGLLSRGAGVRPPARPVRRAAHQEANRPAAPGQHGPRHFRRRNCWPGSSAGSRTRTSCTTRRCRWRNGTTSAWPST